VTQKPAINQQISHWIKRK